MPLTVHLSQRLIMTGLLFGWGLADLAPARYLALSLGVFAVQVRFRHGPLEWLWRGMVYLRLPRMRLRVSCGARR